jgi:four helix bundle protein
MKTFRFLEFKVYKSALIFYRNILKIINKLSDYGLKDQTRRAALSVLLNIAEGSAVKSDKEFARYLEKSLGSINETVACLDIMRDCNYISNSLFLIMINQAELVAKQLGGFKKFLH